MLEEERRPKSEFEKLDQLRKDLINNNNAMSAEEQENQRNEIKHKSAQINIESIQRVLREQVQKNK